MSTRLCIVIPSHWEAIMGGSQYQAKVLVEYLLRHHDVEIFYLTTRRRPDFHASGYRIVLFSSRTGIRRFGFFFDSLRLYRALRRVQPDIIVQFVGCAHTGIAAFYARRSGCRMIWRVSSNRSVAPDGVSAWRINRRIERAFLDYGIRNAGLILAQSHYQRDCIAERFGRQDVVVLPNFHPTPRDVERAQNIRKQVVWIANLKPLKNPGAFLRLAQRLGARSDVVFTMIGRPITDDRWTRRQLAKIAATPNVAFLGEQTQDQVNALLARADLLVNTSDYEGFSNTFIQAWMRRVPVVSLNVDPDGLLSRAGLGAVAHGGELQLARDVSRLLDSERERAAIGARCRAYAVANHGESNLDELARLLWPSLPLPAARAV